MIMLIIVTMAQKSTKVLSQIATKSCLARSINKRAGRKILKTSLLSTPVLFSSSHFILFNIYPTTIIRKMGIVAFNLNIRFSFIENALPYSK